MTNPEFYPCSENNCQFYDKWKIVPETGAFFIGRKNDRTVVHIALICLSCNKFAKKSRLTMKCGVL